MTKQFHNKSVFFGTHFLPPKGPRGKMLTRGPKIGSPAPKSAPGHEQTKDARRKNMQNPALRIPHGGILCKLWPKNIWKGTPPNLGICFKKGNPVSKKGNPAFKKGNPASKGKVLFSRRESCFQEAKPRESDASLGNLMQT